jgi:hypothetical protein
LRRLPTFAPVGTLAARNGDNLLAGKFLCPPSRVVVGVPLIPPAAGRTVPPSTSRPRAGDKRRFVGKARNTAAVATSDGSERRPSGNRGY